MTRSLRTADRAYLDTGSREMIFHGASTKQLAELFNMKEPDVFRKLTGLNPVGVGRQGNPLYTVREAAERLVKIPVTPEMITAHLRRMNPKDLPPVLNKMFWEGMSARRKYEEVTGELWHTTDVAAVLSETFQTLKVSLQLIPDLLSEKSELTDEQLRLAREIVDSALKEGHERLINNLRKPSGRGPGPSAEENEI